MSIPVSEILVVLLVALLVIKPEKLPGAATTLGKWLKWLRQTTATIKQEMAEPLQKVIAEKPRDEKSHD